MPSSDSIHIHNLKINARVGVPEEERANEQLLAISLTLWPVRSFANARDELAETIDYADVCEATKKMLAQTSFKLIETVAEKIAHHLLSSYEIRRVTVEVRKFILPETDYVSVFLTRDCAQQND